MTQAKAQLVTQNELATVHNVKVGDGVTTLLWSDAHAYTVVGRTSLTMTVQRDIANLDGWKPEIIPGGFAGHCINQAQQHGHWLYQRDPNAARVRIYAGKDGIFKTKGARHPDIITGRHEYYDYNF